MRLAIIKNQKVENVVISDLDFAAQMNWDYIILDEGVACEIDWHYDGNQFIRPIRPEPDEALPI
jgi:hypothetical protein